MNAQDIHCQFYMGTWKHLEEHLTEAERERVAFENNIKKGSLLFALIPSQGTRNLGCAVGELPFRFPSLGIFKLKLICDFQGESSNSILDEMHAKLVQRLEKEGIHTIQVELPLARREEQICYLSLGYMVQGVHSDEWGQGTVRLCYFCQDGVDELYRHRVGQKSLPLGLYETYFGGGADKRR